MAFNVAGAGRVTGPYQFIHGADTSSYAVGPSSVGDTFFVSSTIPVAGVIHSVVFLQTTTSATAPALTLIVDGSASTWTIESSTPATLILDTVFNTRFSVSNSSTQPYLVTYQTA